MGDARRKKVIANKENAITGKRPQKPVNPATHGAEKLTEIRALQGSDRAGPPEKTAVETRKNPTMFPAHPYAVKTDESAADSSDIHASNDNDKAISRSTVATQFALRNKVAMGVLAAITIGAGIGSARMSTMSHELTGAGSDSRLSPSLDSRRSLTEVTQDTEIALPPEASLPAADIESNTEGLNATSQQAKQYLGEIEQLRALNASLHEQIDKLGVETTDLNYELLQLELALAEKEANAQALVETRTVYNFVNVSSGNDVQNFNYEENIDYSYNNEQQYLSDSYYDESEQYYEEPIPIEWDSNGQPIAFADAYSNEEPIEWDSNGQPVEFVDTYSEETVLEGAVYYDEQQQYDPNDNVNYQGEQ